jgi:hypothetical protein
MHAGRRQLPVPPVKIARLLYGHSIREMTCLAAVLPEIYKEEKDNLLERSACKNS